MGRRLGSGHEEPCTVTVNMTKRLHGAIVTQAEKEQRQGLRGHFHGNATAVVRRVLIEKFGNDPAAEYESKLDERMAVGVGPVPEREAVR